MLVSGLLVHSIYDNFYHYDESIVAWIVIYGYKYILDEKM